MIGKRVSHYHVLRPLGAGGMGVVYEAEATTPSFSWSQPTMLFEGPFTSDYDVSADGSRFLMIKESEQARAASHFNVIVNWFQELIGKK